MERGRYQMGRVIQANNFRPKPTWNSVSPRPMHSRPPLNYVNISNDIDVEKQEAIKDLRVAVVAHVFYDDLWEELESHIKNIPINYDLYLTMIEGYECQAAKSTTDKIFVLPNKGFDVGPFIYAIKNIDLSQYDLVCKVHTKKAHANKDVFFGTQQRSQLLTGVLDTTTKVTNTMYYLLNSDAGLAGSRHKFIFGSSDITFQYNGNLFEKLSSEFNITLKYKDICYIGGTMFWVKSDILQALKDGPLDFNMFESTGWPHAIASDGQLAHAVERFFGAMTQHLGYQVAGV